ncbi:hypothetical protein [Bacillus tropicus]|uniref:hypothetical protein n=1 Tax=Bacillus tropicus TaxID=2026188 RepID=UPI0015D5F38D|nr:hypothetical protein [Bacillus tropicus]
MQSKNSTFLEVLFLRGVLGLERDIDENLEGDIFIQHMEVLWKGDDKKKKSS